MTPAQFLSRAKRKDIPAVTLFLGQESYNRRRCREAILAAATAPAETFDAAQTSLAAIVDDARSMSLFSSERLMIVTNAEAAAPRASRTAAASDDEDDEGGPSPASASSAMRPPWPPT